MIADNKYTFEIIGNDKTKAAFASLHKSIRSTVNAAGAMGAGIAAGLSVMVVQSTRAGAEMSRLAQSVGVSSETMSEWTHAAKTVNVEGDKMADIFKDVEDKIGDFVTTGGGAAADMFEKLNLNVKDFVGLTADQQLLKIGQALDSVNSRSEKIFFLEALASDASRLLPLLEDNGEQLKVLADEAESLGVSISDIDAAKLEAAARSFERVQGIMAGFGTQVAVEVAPIVEALSERLVQAATEGEQLGARISHGFQVGGKAAGIMADGARGLQVAFKGVEVIGRGMNFVLVSGFVKLIEIIGDVANAIVSGVVSPIRKVLELAAPFSDMAANALADVDNLVEKIEIKVPASMQAFADAQAQAFDIARGELHDLLMQELPSTVIKENIDRILAEADVRAREKVAEIRASIAQDTGEGVSAETEDPREAAEREKLQARLARLDEQYFTETQKLRQKLADEILIIGEAEQAKLITEQDAANRRLRALEGFQKAKVDLEKQGSKGVQGVLQSSQAIIQSFQSSGSKKLFKAQKAASLAQATAELPSAIISSYKNAGGYPFGIPAAIAMAAAGASQIAAIARASIGGGTSSSSSASAGAGTTGQAPSALPAGNLERITRDFDRSDRDRPQTIVQFNIDGDVRTDSAQAVLDEMRTMIEDNDVVLFGPTSRQALEIVGG